jgi:hypothetical protein
MIGWPAAIGASGWATTSAMVSPRPPATSSKNHPALAGRCDHPFSGDPLIAKIVEGIATAVNGIQSPDDAVAY